MKICKLKRKLSKRAKFGIIARKNDANRRVGIVRQPAPSPDVRGDVGTCFGG